MIIVKDVVQAKRRYDLNPDCEMIWLELNSPKVILGVMYRPPSSGEKDLLELQATLMSIPRVPRLCYVVILMHPMLIGRPGRLKHQHP